MNHTPETSPDWEQVDAGFLRGISTQRHAQRHAQQRRRTAIRAAGATAAALLVIVGGVWGLGGLGGNAGGLQGGENYFGGIACRDVGRNLKPYLAGELPAELVAQIDTHLANCQRCQDALLKMRAAAAGQTAANPSRVLLIGDHAYQVAAMQRIR